MTFCRNVYTKEEEEDDEEKNRTQREKFSFSELQSMIYHKNLCYFLDFIKRR